jgi:tryptophan synthase alpha chain
VSPQTKEERIRKIDAASEGFIYMVSSSSTTGIKNSFGPDQIRYFKRMKDMKLRNPMLIGFGISNNESFETVCRYAHGAIIGSAFVKLISESGNIREDIGSFVTSIKEGK